MLKFSRTVFIVCCAVGAVLGQPTTPSVAGESNAPETQFDGTWSTTISCPDEVGGTGAKGYTFQFIAEVKQGVLHAQYRTPDSPGSLTLEGKIQANGAAELNAHGRTGNPEYAVKRLSTGTPYSYLIKVQFENTRGTGTRIDTRPCTFVFSKR
jgi:hypothetical protein